MPRHVLNRTNGTASKFDDMPDPTENGELVEVWQLAELLGLSLRAIRYYEQVGLIESVAQNSGGHQLYGQAVVDRLRVIQSLRNLDFSLEEIGDILNTINEITSPYLAAPRRAALVEQLAGHRVEIAERVAELRRRTTAAERFDQWLNEL